MHNEKSMQWATGLGGLFVFVASVVGVGCDDEVTPPVEEAVLVGASGRFTQTEGELSVSVSPKDTDGNFVGQGLPASAFRFEDVVMASVESPSFEAEVDTRVTDVTVQTAEEGAQLTAVVIFDSSGSMDDNDPGAIGRQQGAEALFDVLSEDDEVALLDFGTTPTPPLLESRLLQDFTSDRDLLEDALDLLTEQGGTPLYESILDGIEMLADADPAYPALVVLTDGQANDASSLDAAIEAAQLADIPVYAIGLGDQLDFTDLRRLTDETGGGYVEASDAVALQAAFAGVSSGLRLGAVSVMGLGMYTLPLDEARYRIRGDLVTTNADGSEIVTPFAFTVDIEDAEDLEEAEEADAAEE